MIKNKIFLIVAFDLSVNKNKWWELYAQKRTYIYAVKITHTVDKFHGLMREKTWQSFEFQISVNFFYLGRRVMSVNIKLIKMHISIYIYCDNTLELFLVMTLRKMLYLFIHFSNVVCIYYIDYVVGSKCNRVNLMIWLYSKIKTGYL